MSLSTRRLGSLAVIVLASVLSVCGGKDQPAAPAGEPSAPPATTPPAPAATPDALFSCHLGDGSETNSCQRENPSFLDDVDAAINKLVKDEPDIFNLEE